MKALLQLYLRQLMIHIYFTHQHWKYQIIPLLLLSP